LTRRGLSLCVLGLAAGCIFPHPAPPPPRAECPGRLAHAVQPGENLYRIALRYGLRPEAVARANGLDDPGKLHAGQVLCIPPSVPERVETARAPDRPHLDWPIRGVFYGRFGKRGGEVHDGIDLAAPAGTPVQAAGPGKVLFAGEQRGYGLLVILEHAPGLVTLYAHNRDLRVTEGQEVRARQVVATVGESGHSSGPHLHFEVRVDGVPVDPLPYLGPPPPASGAGVPTKAGPA
jgi:lipoprotein NlpD